MKNSFYILVMAGGKGTRFWPESTEKKPKQYLRLISEKSLLEETYERFDGLVEKEKRFVITTRDQKNLCEESSKNKITNNGMIFEPSGRNTAPCILLSLAHMISNGVSESEVVAIMPSDHVILNKNGFQKTIAKAKELALLQNKIVTIGITPHFPHTGFGYIEKGELIDGESFKVSKFKEKPHFELAKEYVASGKYLWNAGMFVAPIKVLLEEFKSHAPKIFEHYEALKKAINNEDELAKIYNQIPSDSIDYAIIEKSNHVYVVPANFDWNDLGSWDALSAVIPEKHGNTAVKTDGTYFLNSTDNVIYAPNKFVALINMEKHIIVSNDKVVLVAPVKDAQEIKTVVAQLKTYRPDLV